MLKTLGPAIVLVGFTMATAWAQSSSESAQGSEGRASGHAPSPLR